MSRSLALIALIIPLAFATAPAGGQSDPPDEAVPDELRRELEDEMSMDLQRQIEADVERAQPDEAEQKREFEERLRERFHENMRASTPGEGERDDEREREGEIERELERRFPTGGRLRGIESPIPGCFSSFEELSVHLGGAIGYRGLRRVDFRGSRPADIPFALGDRWAVSRVEVACIGSAWAVLDLDGTWRATPTDLRFVAVFLGNQSWWGSEGLQPSSQLAHEQVHFALAEIVARQTTASIRQIFDLTRGDGDSAASAVDDLGRQFEPLLREAQNDLRELEAKYDRETRHGALSDAQSRWNRRAAAGLSRATKADR